MVVPTRGTFITVTAIVPCEQVSLHLGKALLRAAITFEAGAMMDSRIFVYTLCVYTFLATSTAHNAPPVVKYHSASPLAVSRFPVTLAKSGVGIKGNVEIGWPYSAEFDALSGPCLHAGIAVSAFRVSGTPLY